MRSTALGVWSERIQRGPRLAFESGLLQQSLLLGLGVAKAWAKGERRRTSLLGARAWTSPTAIAITTAGGSLTWADLDDRVDRLASGLRDRLGFRPEHTTVIGARNAKEIYEIDRALAKLSAPRAVMIPESRQDRLRAAARELGARWLITHDGVWRIVGVHPAQTPSPPIDYEELLASSAPRHLPHRGRHPDRETPLARLMMLEEFPVRAYDRHLPACPMGGASAFQILSLTLALGGMGVVETDLDPERFLASVQEHRITTTTMTADLLRSVLDLPATVRANYSAGSLRRIFSAEGVFERALSRRASQAFGNVLRSG